MGLFFVAFATCFASCPKDWVESEYIYNILSVNEQKADLPLGLAHCVSYTESRFKPKAMSRVVNNYRSCGIMQLYRMFIVSIVNKYFPGGYSKFNWEDPDDNSYVGCMYLADLIRKFDGSVYLGVLSFNWGETNVRNMKSLSEVPPKCRQYADQIMKLLDEYDESWR